MHLLRGEIIVWHLALTLLDALFTVKEDLQSVNESDKDAGLRTLAQKYSSQLKELQPDGVAGRDPKYCTPLNCEDKVFCKPLARLLFILHS